MAPTKSLCSERANDWEKKFKPFGIECKVNMYFISLYLKL